MNNSYSYDEKVNVCGIFLSIIKLIINHSDRIINLEKQIEILKKELYDNESCNNDNS